MEYRMGLFDGIAGAVGQLITNDQNRTLAHEAQEFSAQQFANRYQTTVKDMQSAGLNPMLAYSQGGGSPPSAQAVQMQNPVESGVRSFSAASQADVNRQSVATGEAQARAFDASAGLSSAQEAKAKAETNNVERQGSLLEAQAAQAWSTAMQSQANISLINSQVEKIAAEIKNIPTEGDRLRAVIRNLAASNDLMSKQGFSEIHRQANLEAMTDKLVADRKMTEADLDAIKRTGGLGRIAREVQPASDIANDWVKSFLPWGGKTPKSSKSSVKGPSTWGY